MMKMFIKIQIQQQQQKQQQVKQQQQPKQQILKKYLVQMFNWLLKCRKEKNKLLKCI